MKKSENEKRIIPQVPSSRCGCLLAEGTLLKKDNGSKKNEKGTLCKKVPAPREKVPADCPEAPAVVGGAETAEANNEKYFSNDIVLLNNFKKELTKELKSLDSFKTLLLNILDSIYEDRLRKDISLKERMDLLIKFFSKFSGSVTRLDDLRNEMCDVWDRAE